MDEFDIHNRERQLTRALERIKTLDEISETNKDLIIRFHNECFANGLSMDRVLFYLNRLLKLAQWLGKDFGDASRDDVKALVARIERTEHYKEWTKSNYKVTLKRFYKWLEGSDEGYLDKVRWISTRVKNCRQKLTNVLSPDDIKDIIAAASGIRDKALISVLYESGCRIGELLNIRVADVEFDDYGAVIMVTGKTGPRRVRLVSSVPNLSVWIANHPYRGDPSSPVWINTGTTNHHKMMKYCLTRQMIKETAERAGITKPTNPHSFRKARATHLASQLTEAQMKEYFGWVQGSDMASVYVHLSGRDVDDAILRIHGKISHSRQRAEEICTKKCPRCYHENSAEEDFCIRCHLPMNQNTLVELEKRKRNLTALFTPDIMERMVEEKVRQVLSRRGMNCKDNAPLTE